MTSLSASDVLKAGTKLEKLINDCKTLNADRVRVAHGLWVIGRGGGRLDNVSRQKLEAASYFQEADGLAGKADLANSLRFELERIIFYTPPIKRK
jgi:hypothetical protein